MKRTFATLAVVAAVGLLPITASAAIEQSSGVQDTSTCESSVHSAAMHQGAMPMNPGDMGTMPDHDGPAMQALMNRADQAAMSALMTKANHSAMHAVMHGGNGRTSGGMP